MAIARFTLAVNRRFRKEGEQEADFINCVVFGKSAEFAEQYFRKGMRIVVSGRIQTGSYTNREGVRVYTTVVVVEEQEFAESKSMSGGTEKPEPMPAENEDGYIDIPEGIADDLPFN